MTKYIFKKRTQMHFKAGWIIDDELEKVIPRWLLEGRIVPVGVEVKEELKPELADKLEEIKADLMDDGKLNHSNDDKKKSPGRPKKKATKTGLFGRAKKVK